MSCLAMMKSPPDEMFCPPGSLQVTTVSPEWSTSSTTEQVRVKLLPAAGELSLVEMEMITAVLDTIINYVGLQGPGGSGVRMIS